MIYILKARLDIALNALNSIEEQKSGLVRVNEPDEYEKEMINRYNKALAGEYDHTLAFKQKVHYLKTGESIPIL